MKKILFTLLVVLLMSTLLLYCGNGNDSNGNDSIDNNTSHNKPLNITFLLDLSDRLLRHDTPPSQMERDTAIVNFMIDKFIAKSVKDKIRQTENHFQVFFYPAPDNPKISEWSNDLDIDLKGKSPQDKKNSLIGMKEKIDNSLDSIYRSTLANKRWVGCDIWSFFCDKKVDDLCLREGNRNILVILTDGYLYHINNKQSNGNAFSYILPATLNIPNSSLIVKRNGLQDLEVLILEVNPYTPSQRDRLTEVLGNWLSAMDITNFKIVETDIPKHVKPAIQKFVAEL